LQVGDKEVVQPVVGMLEVAGKPMESDMVGTGLREEILHLAALLLQGATMVQPEVVG
jgi:hypothetical protein